MILGIESTAHTFGVAVVNDGKVLSNVRDMYTTEKGGIIPVESAKHHEAVFEKLYKEALEKAKIDEKEIDAIAFSQGPGLAPCLLVGLRKTKEISKKLNIPAIGVNHCIAHLEIGALTGAKDPVLLYASGANTQIIAYTGKDDISRMSKILKIKISDASGKYRVFGETLDIGVGNFIDTFARYSGLGFPGGPKIAELAEKSEMNKNKQKNELIELPYSIKGMDVSFSGIQTKLKQMLDSGKYKIEDLSFSLQETVFAMLVEASERALAHTGKKELLLGGGVACNKRLQEMARIMCEERGCKYFCPENSLLVDNAAMVCYLGEIMFKKGIFTSAEKVSELDLLPRERTDDIKVSWK